MISSEARKAAAIRAPIDVVNLVGLWGMSGEKGREAVGMEARAVVVHGEMRRRSWRGVVDLVEAGEVPRIVKSGVEDVGEGKKQQGKRKAEDVELGEKAGGGKRKQQQQQGQQEGQGNNKVKRKRKGEGNGGGGGRC